MPIEFFPLTIFLGFVTVWMMVGHFAVMKK